MFFFAIYLLNCLLPCCNMLAQPKGFTDDPYVNDEKFIEKGKILFKILVYFYQMSFQLLSMR